jgi:hypothetical protein
MYDDQTPEEPQIAVIGAPYLSPYPMEKSYDSQNAVSTIRQASLTYKKTDFVEVVPERDLANLTSLFAARQLLNFIGVVAHSGQFTQR